MKFIEPRHDETARAILADDTFEQLRQGFYMRLRDDRVRLVILATTLAHSRSSPASAREELQVFAHKLRGAAAVFGAAEIRDAAQAVEVAAVAARQENSDEGDNQLWSALAFLSSLLAAVTDSVTSSPLTPMPQYGRWRP